MADLTLKAAWDGTAVQRGIRSVQQSVGGLKSSIKSIGPTALTALGFGGALGAAVVLRSAIRGLIEDTTATEKLMQTIERRGVAMQVPFSDVENTINRLRLTTAHGDTEITEALTHMVQQSGDLKGSLENLSLAVDLADTHNRSLADTSRIVARVMAGELEMAGDLSNGIKQLVRANSSLIGTTEGTRQALEILRGESLGGSADYLKSTQGSIDNLKDSVKELGEETLRLFVGGGNLPESFVNLANDIDSVTAAIKRMNEGFRESQTASKKWLDEQFRRQRQARPEGDFGSFVNAQLEADYRAGRRLRPGSVPEGFNFSFSNQPQELPFPDLFLERQRREAQPAANKSLLDTIELDLAGRRKSKVRGGPIVLDLIGLGDEDKGATSDEIHKRLMEGFAKDDRLRNELAGTIQGGLVAGFEGGVDAGVQYMIRAFRDALLGEVAGALAGFLIPGGSTGGGILSGIFGGRPSRPGAGIENARTQGMQTAALRRGLARG